LPILDLRHLADVPVLLAPSRRAAGRHAITAGLRPRDVRRASIGAGNAWVIGYPADPDASHWTLLADEHTLITVPARREPADPHPMAATDDWKVRHRRCPVCDWYWGAGYRRLTPTAWRHRTDALLPLAAAGPRFDQAVRDQLVTALRMHQTGRPHEASYWLGCAERAAAPARTRRRRPRRRRSAR
jgi:hypothetical protein